VILLFLHILFWATLALILHTYLVFPVWLDIKLKLSRKRFPSPETHYPSLSIIIPAYNEERIIRNKILNLYACNYPENKMEVLVMSDASTDHTDNIVLELTKRYPSLRFTRSPQRIGKPSILNRLAEQASGEILVLTDANVMLAENTLQLITRHFSDPGIGLVDTCLIGINNENNRGVAFQEKKYTSREVMIKYREGLLWGIIMGPSGACYALRKELFRPVPSNFLVDDFYINMKVLEQNHKAIVEPSAVVYEDTIHTLKEAFRRKVRIATGNFQNLRALRKLFRNIFKPTGFCFWSHKGIRWFVPWLILLNLTANLFLALHFPLYLLFLSIHLLFLFLILIDNILKIFRKQIVILRFVTHFYSMNLALAAGLIKALKGVTTNVWEPTERNQ